MKWVLFFLIAFSVGGLEAKAQVEAVAVDTTTYDFGSVLVNTSRSVSFVITNTGTTDLVPESSTIRGASFSARHTCTRLLKPQETCQVWIRFEPFFEGLYTGLFESMFQGGTGVAIRLWGRGLQF